MTVLERTRQSDAESNLQSRRFRLEREAGWFELESLIEKLRNQGSDSLTADETERLPILYRNALSSLSVARAIALDRALLDYLENLATRSYLAVYSRPARVATEVVDFVCSVLPRAVRSVRWHAGIIAIVLFLGSLSGFVLVDRSEGWFTILVPDSYAGGRGPLSTTTELRQVLSAGLPDAQHVLSAIAETLFSHNTTIGLLMFGLGMLAGFPTILLTFEQGLLLGAFFALHAHRGLTIQFAGWVFIHGVTELGALILFGAAGLRLGELLVFPGVYSRAENFANHGPALGAVAIGAGAMLLIAAVLEGFFRQAIVSTDIRLTVALATLTVWLCYFGMAARVQGAQ